MKIIDYYIKFNLDMLYGDIEIYKSKLNQELKCFNCGTYFSINIYAQIKLNCKCKITEHNNIKIRDLIKLTDNQKVNFMTSNMYKILGDKMNIKYSVFIENSKQTLPNFIKKYGEVDGKIKWDIYTSKLGTSLKHYISRYGEIEGTKKYNEYSKKIGLSLHNYIRRYGEINGTLKYNEYREQNKNRCSLDWYISKYGDKIGNEKYIELCKTKCVCKKSDFIKRHSTIEGTIKFNSFVEKSKQTLENFIKRDGETIGTEKYKEFCRKSGQNSNNYSNISQELFNAIKEHCSSNNLRYATHNNELCLYDHNHNRTYFYDFVDVKTKKIIEYHGDIFHANPAIHNKNDRPNPYDKKLKSSEIWEYDNIKQKLAEDKGYTYHIIWDSEYRNNTETSLNTCLDYLGL